MFFQNLVFSLLASTIETRSPHNAIHNTNNSVHASNPLNVRLEHCSTYMLTSFSFRPALFADVPFYISSRSSCLLHFKKIRFVLPCISYSVVVWLHSELLDIQFYLIVNFYEHSLIRGINRNSCDISFLFVLRKSVY